MIKLLSGNRRNPVFYILYYQTGDWIAITLTSGISVSRKKNGFSRPLILRKKKKDRSERRALDGASIILMDIGGLDIANELHGFTC